MRGPAAAALLALATFPPASRAGEGDREIRPDEVVELLPAVGRKSGDGAEWLVPVVARVYDRETDSLKRKPLIALFRKALGIDEDENEETATFRERAARFLVDGKEGRRVVVRVAGEECPVADSGRGGYAEAVLRLPAARAAEGWLRFEAVLPEGDPRRFEGRALLLAGTGVSVVSDVDDTVKETGVRERRRLIADSLSRPWRPIPGMAALYRRWEKEGAAFHFVTAEPGELRETLERFLRDGGFPEASLHMRRLQAREAETRSFLDLFPPAERVKPALLDPLFDAFPRRRFVLVGDSGEADPEVYGAAARTRPGQVAAILIREAVPGGSPPERYAKAFRGLPRGQWRVFADPAELGALPR